MTATATAVDEKAVAELNRLTGIMEKVNATFASRFLKFDVKSSDDGKVINVHRRAGPNASDKMPLGPGISIIPTDVRQFIDANPSGAENIIGALDGSSWQVKADDVVRSFYENGGKPNESGLAKVCEDIWSRIQGIRPARAPRSHPLPNGDRYVGNDLVEFRLSYRNAMELEGASSALAEAIANKMTF